MQPDELTIELEPDTRLQDLLTRLEDAPLRCRARLYAARGLTRCARPMARRRCASCCAAASESI